MLLILLTIKCSDHTHAGQTLIQNEIELIQLRLHDAEHWDGLAHQDKDGGHENGNDHHQNPGESTILVEPQNNPANQRHSASTHHIHHQTHHLLNLLPIIVA